MTTVYRSSHATALVKGALYCTLLLAPMTARAQGNVNLGPGTLSHNTSGYNNTAIGYDALDFNTTGRSNVANGNYALYSNTTGSNNTANGASALVYNTTGGNNVANGDYALFSNTTGSSNVANGNYSLYSNTTGSNNTANGTSALVYNTTGGNNVANGLQALYSNTTGSGNTANGVGALYSSTTAYNNTANGYQALLSNTIGYENTANGTAALLYNTTGSFNTANGYFALVYNTTGYYNTADGTKALYSNTTGAYNVGLGYQAGNALTTGSNNIDISNAGIAGESGVIRIGTSGTQTAAYIAGISGVTTSRGVAVYINANGQLGTLTSSRRFKNDIHTMGNVSDKLMKLRPVTFRYKDSAEKGPHALQYGLIAEEVAKVYPDLVQYDKQGKPFTVYYHLLTPMILSELQKEHRQNVAMKSAMNSKFAALTVAHNTEVAALKAELTAVKLAQQQQMKVLAKMAAFIQTSQSQAQSHKASLVLP